MLWHSVELLCNSYVESGVLFKYCLLPGYKHPLPRFWIDMKIAHVIILFQLLLIFRKVTRQSVIIAVRMRVPNHVQGLCSTGSCLWKFWRVVHNVLSIGINRGIVWLNLVKACVDVTCTRIYIHLGGRRPGAADFRCGYIETDFKILRVYQKKFGLAN